MSASSTSAALSPAPLAGDLPTLLFPVSQGDIQVFDPDPFDVSASEEVLLKFLGTGSADVTIYDSNENPYALFKDGSNPYSVSNDGTAYTVRDDAPEGASYTIQYDPGSALSIAAPTDSISAVPVRGTINVKKPPSR